LTELILAGTLICAGTRATRDIILLIRTCLGKPKFGPGACLLCREAKAIVNTRRLIAFLLAASLAVSRPWLDVGKNSISRTVRTARLQLWGSHYGCPLRVNSSRPDCSHGFRAMTDIQDTVSAGTDETPVDRRIIHFRTEGSGFCDGSSLATTEPYHAKEHDVGASSSSRVSSRFEYERPPRRSQLPLNPGPGPGAWLLLWWARS
jgi:hypothetical protein